LSREAAGCLILICGLPGSGKTTLARRFEQERRGIRLCPDDWIERVLGDPTDSIERDRLRDPMENLQWELALNWLQMGFTVILENGFWAEEERFLYAMGAVELGATIELHYLPAPDLEALWDRVSARNARLEGPTFVMSKEELGLAWRAFEPPTREELEFYDEWAVWEQ
jgi:predicted kinase